ncbi:hypothetical protein [Photobacterium kasasachensis]|uniref:hypothetical protein n=1 Tax=Photobacterium kasasachensis TaxID=2910240 RepID=UPI003D0B0F48
MVKVFVGAKETTYRWLCVLAKMSIRIFHRGKRLSHTKIKQEIIRGIERLYCSDKALLGEHCIVDFADEYVIALSDVWLETKWKK